MADVNESGGHMSSLALRVSMEFPRWRLGLVWSFLAGASGWYVDIVAGASGWYQL
jgi:hypothetical protein